MMDNFNKRDMFLARQQYLRWTGENYSNEDLVELIKNLLQTDVDLDFLLELRTRELKILAARIRDRIGRVGN